MSVTFLLFILLDTASINCFSSIAGVILNGSIVGFTSGAEDFDEVSSTATCLACSESRLSPSNLFSPISFFNFDSIELIFIGNELLFK